MTAQKSEVSCLGTPATLATSHNDGKGRPLKLEYSSPLLTLKGNPKREPTTAEESWVKAALASTLPIVLFKIN